MMMLWRGMSTVGFWQAPGQDETMAASVAVCKVIRLGYWPGVRGAVA